MRATLGFVAVGLVSAAPAHAEDPLCARAQHELDTLARTLESGRALVRIAPYISAKAVPTLLKRAEDPAIAFDALLTAGLTTHAQTLRMLRGYRPKRNEEARLGYAVALLALGDGSTTATVSQAAASADVEIRRELAKALALIPAARPRDILYEMMKTDDDPYVRFFAARALTPTGSTRARRTLYDLLSHGPAEIRRRTARTLTDLGRRVSTRLLWKMPQPMQGLAYALHARRGRSDIVRRLAGDLRSKDESRRVQALAGWAIARSSHISQLKSTTKSYVVRYGEEFEAQVALALALMGDEKAIETLSQLDEKAAKKSIEVLFAYSGGAEIGAVKPEVTARITDVIETWLLGGLLDPRSESRALRAMELLDPDAARRLARTRLRRGDGWGLRTALRVLGRHGAKVDMRDVANIGGENVSPTSKLEAWRAVRRLCAL